MIGQRVPPEQRMARAETTNADRDAMERRMGYRIPMDGPLDETYRTIICALWAGVQTDDWSCVEEGLAMLGELVGYRPWRVA